MAGLSPVGRVEFQPLRQLRLPPVAIGQQLGLVVEQLLARLGRELEIRPLDDGIHRAGFLAQAAINAFHHIDVVARGAARAILTRFGLDGDGLRRAHRLAELAGDAALLAIRVAPQRVLAVPAGLVGFFSNG